MHGTVSVRIFAYKERRKMKEFSKKDSTVAKGVAVLLLLFYHLFKDLISYPDVTVSHRPFSAETFVSMAEAARVCVAMFVLISAYGIAKTVLNDETVDLLDAYKAAFKRFGKLMLNFFILYVSVWVLWFWKFDINSVYGSGKQSFILMIFDALGLASTFGMPTLNATWWYMGLAYLIIFTVPLIAFFVKKTGYAIIPLAVFITYMLETGDNIEFYLITMSVGVVAAYGKWFEKISDLKFNIVLKWIILILGSIILLTIRQNAVVKEYLEPVFDSICAVWLVVFSGSFISTVPVLSKVIEFIGTHSLNIFLVHSFFYLILFREYVYHFKPAGACFIILLALSLAYSVILDLIKTGVSRLVKDRDRKDNNK